MTTQPMITSHTRPLTHSPSGSQLSIDLGAIATNVAHFAALAPRLMAVVKADAFGHGAPEVARTALAHGASWLGVTSIEEALALRAVGIDAPLLSWLNPVDADFDRALLTHIEVAVPGLDHLRAVVGAARRTGVVARVHLHVDTGMARDGASPGEWAGLCLAARAAERRGTVQVHAVMGHLGYPEVPQDPLTTAARSWFARALAMSRSLGLRPQLAHLAATTATLTDPRTHHDLCRVGAGLYGIGPGLRPAITLTAPVVTTRRVAAGSCVGYGTAHRVERAGNLALLPLGYADGLPRTATDRAEVWLAGRRRRVVGLISMDQIVVDLGDDTVTLGEEAVVLGPGDRGEPTAAEWADWSGTLPHEILTGLGRRSIRTHLPVLRGLR